MSRDKILATLWPEEDGERARHSLSQALYLMKRDLGVEAVLSDQVVRLDGTQIHSDIEEFRAAVAEHDWERAADHYGGVFLDGFYLTGSAGFERWVEEERHQVAVEAERALGAAIELAAAGGRTRDAAEFARKLSLVQPLDADHALSYMKALAAVGDRARAVAHARIYETRVRAELEMEPDARVRRLADELRRSVGSVGSETVAPPTSPASPTPPTPSTARKLGYLAAGLAVLAVGTWLLARRSHAAKSVEHPLLAVGALRDLASADTLKLGPVLSEMLTTSLGRLTDLEVVATSRILELLPRDATDPTVGRVEAARRAGANEVLEGELTSDRTGRLRLDLRRVDLRTGVLLRGYRAEAEDRFALIDSVTAQVAADLRLRAPTGSVTDVTTYSPVALRFYEEGLHHYYRGDLSVASQFFNAAIREDTSFAMAAYYAWISTGFDDSLGARAYRLASRSSDRNRLIVMTTIEGRRQDLVATVRAESLAARFRNDPEALMVAGAALQERALPDPKAIDILNRVIALDSAAGGAQGVALGTTGVCRLCLALNTLESHYVWADSAAAINETLRRWKRLAPADPSAWFVDAELTVRTRGVQAATRSLAIEDSLRGRSARSRPDDIYRYILAEEFEDGERICGLGVGTPVEATTMVLACTVLLRQEGRYREAERLVREGRWGETLLYASVPHQPYLQGVLDLDRGQGEKAGRDFLDIAGVFRKNPFPGLAARNVAWNLTLAATALAMAGQWTRVAALADTVREVGQNSSFGRDPLLHFFISGLVAAGSGQQAAAVDLFRRSVFSWTNGYTRANAELAKSLLQLHRPAEAIRPLQAALRGGLYGSGLYLSRTELHELLARAFAAAGQRDSAAFHYERVARAWAKADPEYRGRYQEALRLAKR